MATTLLLHFALHVDPSSLIVCDSKDHIERHILFEDMAERRDAMSKLRPMLSQEVCRQVSRVVAVCAKGAR